MSRLWGIRHARWLYHSVRFAIWWEQARHIFIAPNPSDIRYLDAIWRGEV